MKAGARPGADRPIRVTAVLTHPVQYYAPWFRFIAARCPEIALTVLFAARPSPAQQGIGFGAAFEWDVPLTEGYDARVLRQAAPAESLDSGRFWGLDVAGIGAAIRDTRPDVALVPGWHSVTLVRALLACRRQGIPALYRGDTHLGNAPAGWRRPLWAARTRLLLRLFDGWLAVGTRARAYLRHFGADPARIFDAPHCVDNEAFAARAAPHQTPAGRAAVRAALGIGPRDFAVLFAGKLEPKKRPLDLIRAIAGLGPGASLLVVGAGPLEGECRAEAAGRGVTVRWAGFVNQGQLGRPYAAADCLALPSDWGETWGLVVNEALATGLPCVVADRVGSAPDLIAAGETGEVFPTGDVPALTAALDRLRARTEGGHDWRPACRARAQAHSLERAAAGLLAGCRAVTARRRGGAPAAPRVVACCGAMVMVGGLERMTFEALRVVKERGGAVHCIVNSWASERIVALAEGVGASWSTGYYWHRLDRRARDPRHLARIAWDVAMTSLGLLRDARARGATHVLIPEHETVLRNALALPLLRLRGTTVIVNLQNAPAEDPFYRRLWRWAVAPLVDHVVCCAPHVQAVLVAHGVPRRKTSVIVNTAPRRAAPAQPGASRDPRTIVFVGQIIPEKGLDLLLDALALLVERGHDARVAVAGQMQGWVAPAYAGYRERLLSRAAAPDLVGRVQFLGWREDVPALLAQAAVHCCPSRPEMREGLPLVCLEAKLAGLPTVAFSVGPFPALIAHREEGWICEEISAASLADGLEPFLRDPALRERAGRAARASARRFAGDGFAQAWWDVFTSAAPGDSRGGA